MKTHHTTTLGKTSLKLSLTFETSLELNEKVGSPTLIGQETMKALQAERAGRTYLPRIELDERKIMQILCIGSGKEISEIGPLVMEEGVIFTKMKVLEYLSEMVMGRSKEVESDGDSSAGE